ncbi:MAG: diacylglycerol kinase family lipid kinase [Gemmatimonadota bacterium]|jgi:YegS/Rv2252/BmrU family lipid kinase|nr:diacylglycerol kinase family lipid kinase [Gemmatimonadota bacterium]MDP6528647.1 diacylglycerol kinase family lipid kinase [Gemmatimonadota bacterium]MDP6803068.1 diacylglycerol kinase family lipid kinase [Gemmatimonadota bacterium]
MSVAFVVNPAAGRGACGALAETLPGLLKARGMDAEVLRTNAPEEAVHLARGAAQDGRIVVAVGGDGTAHEVVNGIAGTGARFGLIPAGTGNDLAQAMGIPADPAAALDVLVHGRHASFDLGRFDDGWFVNSLGLGFEAQVTAESRRIRRIRGFAVYLVGLIRALTHLHCPRLDVRIDGERVEERMLLVSIGNGHRVGGGFLLTPDADPADGLLDVCLVRAMGRSGVLRMLPRALTGKHMGANGVRMLRARQVEITSPDGFPLHADGEIRGMSRKRLSVSVHPGALPVVLPAEKACPAPAR